MSVSSADVNKALNELIRQGLVIVVDKEQEEQKLYYCEYCGELVADLGTHECEKGVR